MAAMLETTRQESAPASLSQTVPPLATRIVFGAAIVVLLAHLTTNIFTPYGIHRDEFLYMAMGRHLRLFRMDFPPMIAILAEFSRLFGDALVFLRLTPALAASGLVVLAASIARLFGGGRYAQLLAALATATGPLFLRSGNLFQPVVFDQLWWTFGYFAFIQLAREAYRGNHRWWLLLGLSTGLGLLTKFSIAFFGVGIVVGLLSGPHRRALLTSWPWIAVGIALFIGSPSIIGQIRLDFPVIGQMQALGQTQLERVTYLDFLVGQVIMFGPAFILAAIGLVYLLAGPSLRPYRPIGWAILTSFLVVLFLQGKPYYIGPVYPALFGAGAFVIEAWASRLKTRNVDFFAGALRIGTAALILAYGMLTLPLGLPVLPPEPMSRYAKTLGVTEAVTTNTGQVLSLPQDYADMLGWEAMVETVAAVYRELPPKERDEVVIVGGNYGEAGAVDFYGPRLGLPPAVFPVSTYWFFGPGEKPGEVIIKIGGTRDDLTSFCRSITLAARINEPWVVPEERNVPVWICREPYRTLQEIWPQFKGQF